MQIAEQRVIVKIKGPRRLLLQVKDCLEREFIAVPTSKIIENDKEDGCHIYIAILGVK